MLTFIYYTALLIGTIKAIQIIYGVMSFMHQHLIRRKRDLYQRYADPDVSGRSWAVITGASDGIGAEFCKQLASEGFNIALVSRTL